MKKALLSALLLGSCFARCQGLVDGFFKGKGNVDVALSATYQGSSKYFAGTNLINYSRSILSLSAFAEYGITEKWDVIGNVPVVNFSFQDAGVFTKYQLLKTTLFKHSFSIIPAVGVSFPLSNYETESGQAIGQKATIISSRVVLQQELPKGMFLQVQSGYNYAIDPVTSSFPISMKWGISFGKSYADLWFDHQTGFGDKDYQGSTPFLSFRELVVSYNRIGGVFYHQLQKKTGVFLNYSYVLNGRNIGKSFGVGAGGVFKF